MSEEKNIFAMFPGQGSQSVGMGKELYESSEQAKELFGTADKALGFSLSEICFEGPAEKLTETAITQPAILTVSVISYALYQAGSPDGQIVAGAGHSLGEYSALVAAGAISFEDAVQLVHKRGSYMQEAVPVGAGKMVAVLGKEIDEIESVLSNVEGTAEIANINAPGQVVVAGSSEGIDEFVAKFEGAKVKELPVSAPFHCSLMKPAADNLAKDLDALTIEKPAYPIFANYSAQPVTDAESIRIGLKEQVCGRVRWVECVENASQAHQPAIAYEFGSGKVLAGLMRRINKGLTVENIYSS